MCEISVKGPLGASALDAREPVSGYRHKMVLCSHLEYSICDCVLLLHFALSDAILKHELSSGEQSSGLPGTYKNCVHKGTRRPLLYRVQGRARGPLPCPNSIVGT